MKTADSPSYDELPERLQRLADKLRSSSDAAVVNEIDAFIQWNDDFHRRGLTRLVEMIQASQLAEGLKNILPSGTAPACRPESDPLEVLAVTSEPDAAFRR
jgi:predicted transcriptional regulator